MNAFDKYLGMPTLALSILSTMLSVCISVGYVIITITSIYGLALAIAMALSNMIVASIILYTTIKLNNKDEKIITKTTSLQNKIIDIAFGILAFLILMGGLSAFITSYQGVLLLSTALALTIPSSSIIGIAIFVGAVAFFGYILYASKIAVDLYSRLPSPLSISENNSSGPKNLHIVLPADKNEFANILATESKSYKAFFASKQIEKDPSSIAIIKARRNSL